MSKEIVKAADFLGIQKEIKEIALERFVGAILFKNLKLAIVGSDVKGDLLGEYIDLSEDEVTKIDKKSNRILDLSDFDEIAITQADLGAVQIRTATSIRQRKSSVSAKISFTSCDSSKEEGFYILDEAELMETILGKKGGLAFFYGGQGGEENALIIEKSIADRKTATIIFLHPTASIWGLDSVNGVGEFFKRLNGELLKETSVSQEIRKLIDFLELQEGKDKLEEPWGRLEIFKAYLLGLERTAGINKDREPEIKDDVFIELNHVFAQYYKKRLFGGSKMLDARRLSSCIDLVIGKMNIKRIKPSEEEIQTGSSEEYLFLESNKANDLYDGFKRQLGDKFGNNDSPEAVSLMDRYVVGLVVLIRDAVTEAQLRDAIKLLDHLSTTKYGNKNSISCSEYIYTDYLDPKKYLFQVTTFTGAHNYNVGTIINWLRDATGKRLGSMVLNGK